MFLKRISISGFKSFADKVDFDFDSGVTCIVGPNGCGKSNVVDAVKWVLGEQSARSLRGRQMIDMIFAGSTSRRASSVACVDLLFDNTDRKLQIEQPEVTVTRKLYRSGESEYLLNKDAVRLKDVRELFMDTGVGTDAYSVIEQGKVDLVLQSSPADRRFLFEEAAGVSKYKARKREAERKLERTAQNLVRVTDIIDEVEKRLRSVKLQAGRARSFQAYQGRLNELRSSYALAEYHRFTEEIADLERDARQRTDAVAELRAKIGRSEADEAEVTEQLDRLAESINTADNDLVRTRSEIATHEERVAAAQARIAEQQAQLERSRDRADADARRRESTQAELAAARHAIDAFDQDMRTLQTRIDELADIDRAKSRETADAQAALEDEKAGIIDLLRKSAHAHNEIVRCNTHRESLVGHKGRLSARSAQISAELESYLQQKAELQARLDDVDRLVERETRVLEDKQREAERIESQRRQLVAELANAKEARSAMQSRREVLEDLQRNMEGVGEAARQLLETARHLGDDAIGGIRGLVADLIEVDLPHARVVEAALGDADRYVVVADGRAFLSSRDALQALPGGLTAICLDRLPPIVNERDFSDQPGVVARGVDLVRVPDACEHLARHLLGKTIVVDTVEHAIALASDDVAGHKFVTLGGTVIEPDGRIRVGPPASAAGLISRRSELRAIDSELSEFRQRVDRLADRLGRTETEIAHLQGVQHDLRGALYDLNTARVEAAASIQNIGTSIERITNERPVIAHEVAMLEHEINETLQRTAETGKSLEALEAENREREAIVARHQQRIDDIVATRQRVQEQMTELRVQHGQLSEKRDATARSVDAFREQIRDLDASVADARSDIARCSERIQQADATCHASQASLAELATTIEQLVAQGMQLRERRDVLRRKLEGLGESVKTARAELESVEAALHDAEMACTAASVRRDELVARVRDELDIDLADRYQAYAHAEQDWHAVEAEIETLQGKIRRLGNVNLDAITELAELEERHGFLTGQRDDLTDAHDQLRRLIDKLNKESVQRFKTTFDQIRDNFRVLFRKLFGGGRADIVLDDPEDILECGIDIVAQPPGKELQSISLMSGGEKTMTAIALLMSIFRTRPAPFAILDEVDAALDETNNERFNRIIDEFVTDSQFIVVTHSKVTMASADRLYGITMQEPGVSTRVSVDLQRDTDVA
ncbi:MAG: chromosome segregation protein SMC [Phycisphaerae bacterium]